MRIAPLVSAGRALAMENATEVMVPLAAATASLGGLWWVLGGLRADGGLSDVELGVMLIAAFAVVGWAAGRQVYLFGKRSPRTALLAGVIAGGVTASLLARATLPSVTNACEALGGQLVEAADGRRCRVGAPDNRYLPGTLYRSAWSGALGVPAGIALSAVSGLVALGWRDRRISRSKVPVQLREKLQLALSPGSASVLHGPPDKLGVQACSNPTLWGETCGQLYARSHSFAPGEWCQRCQQPFRPVDRYVTLKVVSLFSGDVDVLNALERFDHAAWPVGTKPPLDARPSGQERWVTLGTISVPDVLTIAQTLALVYEQLPTWESADSVFKAAKALAEARASGVHAWLWQGEASAKLTWARPTAHARLAVGPARLRDFSLNPGTETYLQLDIGLLPLDVRQGLRWVKSDGGELIQNVRTTLWVPVGPVRPSGEASRLWVPRIEGKALLSWLAQDRVMPAGVRGVSSPLPYDGRGSGGSLDFVRYRLPSENEFVWPPRAPGASVSEWDWFEAEQIELLRNEALVQERT